MNLGRSLLLFLLFSQPLFRGLMAQSDTTIQFELRFALDSDRLSSDEKARLDSLLAVYPIYLLDSIKFYGHTDSLADLDYNRRLSKRRVQEVLKQFVLRGLDPLKARSDYYGEERPAYRNSPEERFKNRRVQLMMYLDLSLLPNPEQKLSEQKLKKGDKLRLANLNFVGNQAIPMWHSFDALRELLRAMEANPDLEISLQGHVCCSNDFELSVARARMVYDFLVAEGISKVRLDYQGFGNKVPLFDELDEASRALNRRVEIEVLANSEERVEAEARRRLQIEAPVMNVQFNSGTSRLSPSGDFMLTLIAEMLKESEDLSYEFVVYDNIDNKRLSGQRASTLERTLRKKGVAAKIFKVSTKANRPGLPRTADYNWIRILMKEK